jgi:hypothetical protein
MGDGSCVHTSYQLRMGENGDIAELLRDFLKLIILILDRWVCGV